MKNRFIKAFNALKSNKGTGILMVLIATLLITVLGVAMLFTSYINLTMKISERQGRINFYDAEEVMDQIKVGFQNYFSEVIADATKSTLTLAPSNTVEKQDFFNDEVRDAVRNGHIKDYVYDEDGNIASYTEYDLIGGTAGIRATSLALFLPPHSLVELNKGVAGLDGFTKLELTDTVDGWSGTYPAKMKIEGDTVIIEFVDGSSRIREVEETYITPSDEELTLQSYIFPGIKVTHINGETGYTTTVTSDIVLQSPVFNVGQVGYSLNEITSFSMIADESLVVVGIDENSPLDVTQPNTVNIKGNIYAGNVTLSQSKNLDYSVGNLILGESDENSNASVDIGSEANDYNLLPTFNLDSSAQLWANGINLYSNAEMNISGSAYIADDLKFDSKLKGASFNLSGSYFGFGFGKSGAVKDPHASSSILIDGKDNNFVLTPTSNLLLYGSSYVVTDTINQQLGESLSPSTNQLAYLVPSEFLSNISSNPYYLNTSVTLPDINSGTVANSVLWEIDGRPMTVSDYCVEDNPVNIYRTQSSGASWVYFFFNFKDTESANKYFNDYFLYGGDDRQNYDRISEQLNYHFNEFSTLSSNIISSGNIIQERPLQEGEVDLYRPDSQFDSDEKYQILGGFSDLSAEDQTTVTQQYSNQYEVLKRPYSDVVTNKVTALSDVGEVYQFIKMADETDINNSPVAIYVNGDYVYDSTVKTNNPDLCLIIASGDVRVQSDFSGLIISDGTVTVDNDVNSLISDSLNVRSALGAVLVETESGVKQVATEDDGTTFLFAELLSQSGTVEGSEVESSQLEDRTIEELVSYENWKKD